MDLIRPMPPTFGAVSSDLTTLRMGAVSASHPRPDLPPVTATHKPAATAPRPPDQSYLGLVQAGLLSSPAPIRDYSPERALKPWGVVMLPDSASAEARREAKEARQASVAVDMGPASAPDTLIAAAPLAPSPPPGSAPVALAEPDGPTLADSAAPDRLAPAPDPAHG